MSKARETAIPTYVMISTEYRASTTGWMEKKDILITWWIGLRTDSQRNRQTDKQTDRRTDEQSKKQKCIRYLYFQIRHDSKRSQMMTFANRVCNVAWCFGTATGRPPSTLWTTTIRQKNNAFLQGGNICLVAHADSLILAPIILDATVSASLTV